MTISFDTTQILIGGRWRAAGNGETIDVINPSTGEEVCKIGRGSAQDIDDAVAAAEAALNGEWGKMSATERGRVLSNISVKIKENEVS